MKKIQKIVSLVLITAFATTTFSSMALASSYSETINLEIINDQMSDDQILEQIKYYESIEDYDSVEKIVDETLDSKTGNFGKQRVDPLSLIASVLAIYGANYGGAYAVGEFCYNNNISYAAGQAALYLAVGGLVPNTFNIVIALGYDNGWNAAQK